MWIFIIVIGRWRAGLMDISMRLPQFWVTQTVISHFGTIAPVCFCRASASRWSRWHRGFRRRAPLPRMQRHVLEDPPSRALPYMLAC